MFKNIKIGWRLGIAFAALLLLLAATGSLGILQALRINAGAHELATNWLPSVSELGEIRAAANSVRRAGLRHVLEVTPEGKAVQQALREKAINEQLNPALERYSKLVSSAEEQKLYEGIKEKLAASWAEDLKMLAASQGNEAEFSRARQIATGESAAAFSELADVIKKDVELNVRSGQEEGIRAGSTFSSAVALLLAMIAGSVLLGAWLAWYITRSITGPIQRAVDIANTVAEGDLSSRIDVQGKDETAQLLQALSRMNENLARIVCQVRNSSDSIATGSAQIATGNADLSQRTEEQASNLEQTAASMEQISGTVKASAETAAQANELAASASAAATKGGDMVGQAVNSMQDIAASSRKIADIIGVIDGIAFQTNILALNAAVEAARAGEQGRGFAVVASEVRNLSGRSAEAAKEIKALIGASVEKVEAGARQVNDAGASMAEIVAQVQRVSQMISELSAASQEQSIGINQVGEAVTQLDQVTQQNAALVEESAAAAESLKHQAATLAEVVRVFKVAPGHAMVAGSPVVPVIPAVYAPAAERRSPNQTTNMPRTAFKAPAAKPKTVTPVPTGAAVDRSSKTGTADWETF